MMKPVIMPSRILAHHAATRTVAADAAANSPRSHIDSHSASGVLLAIVGCIHERIILRCGSGASGGMGIRPGGAAPPGTFEEALNGQKR